MKPESHPRSSSGSRDSCDPVPDTCPSHQLSRTRRLGQAARNVLSLEGHLLGVSHTYGVGPLSQREARGRTKRAIRSQTPRRRARSRPAPWLQRNGDRTASAVRYPKSMRLRRAFRANSHGGERTTVQGLRVRRPARRQPKCVHLPVSSPPGATYVQAPSDDSRVAAAARVSSIPPDATPPESTARVPTTPSQALLPRDRRTPECVPPRIALQRRGALRQEHY